MQDLLPFYERELAFLRRHSQEFAKRYPKIAARLAMSQDGSEDPHVERLVQSFALLSARISKKLDDDYPEFTEALLEVLYPHYLRPFPSCSIAQFDLGAAAGQLNKPVRVARGTELTSHQVKGVACRFTTCYDVSLSPVKVSDARFQTGVPAPASVPLPRNASALLSLTLTGADAVGGWDAVGLDTLRVFVDADTSIATLTMDMLFGHAAAAFVEGDTPGRWAQLRSVPVEMVGMSEEEALVPTAPRSHPAYRLLAEHFAFPEKFHFFDIDLAAVRRVGPNQRSLTLHIVLADVRANSHAAQILEGLQTRHFRTGCTPVINLFAQKGDPIRLTHTTEAYPVLADARRAFAYEVYSIDAVKLVRQTAEGDAFVDFHPFYSLRHGETPLMHGHYWLARHNAEVAERSPGYETEISIVDLDFNPVVAQSETLSLDLRCTNRNLPTMLAFGAPGGDLFIEGNSVARQIRLLRRPTSSLQPHRGKGTHWRLISQLALNHLSLVDGGAGALKELLQLYDWKRSAATLQQIDSIADVTNAQSLQWLPGKPFATFVRGVEITMRIDESRFVGSSLQVFTGIMDRFFGLYVHLNSFTQLVVVSAQQGKELARCKPRSGESILL